MKLNSGHGKVTVIANANRLSLGFTLLRLPRPAHLCDTVSGLMYECHVHCSHFSSASEKWKHSGGWNLSGHEFLKSWLVFLHFSVTDSDVSNSNMCCTFIPIPCCSFQHQESFFHIYFSIFSYVFVCSKINSLR